jgi:hypothetical protein
MKTDGIYRFRLDDPPPKRVEKWWHDRERLVRGGTAALIAILVSDLRRRDVDWWFWAPLILIAMVLVRLLVDSICVLAPNRRPDRNAVRDCHRFA